MKRLSYILLLVLLFAGSEACARGYRLVWKETFNGSAIDETKWSRISRGKPDWCKHMSKHDALYEVKRGKLVLRALENNGVDPADTAKFITGGVCSQNKATITYGKVEVRAKLPDAQSVWPAIWMLPQAGRWPDGGEIDIMEHLNHDKIIYQTVHTHYTYTLGKGENPPHGSTAPIRPGRYNVYGVEILKDCLRFYVNGKLTMTYPKVPELDPELAQYPFGTPFYLLIDMQIGGAWIGPAEGTDLPAEMSVDWVKFYTDSESCRYNF